jgi:hypothetical protein
VVRIERGDIDEPASYATKHERATSHLVIRSFEPDEEWFYDYRSEGFFEGPGLAPAQGHPPDQGVRGPAGSVPSDWESKLHT